MAAKTSIWRPLKHGGFRSLWLASVLSGCCVSGQDLAATWLLNDLQAPAFFLSAMATCAALPFLLFTLPTGVIADLGDRRKLLRFLTVWLALNAAWLGVVTLLGQAQPP
jgi:MFS family permease